MTTVKNTIDSTITIDNMDSNDTITTIDNTNTSYPCIVKILSVIFLVLFVIVFILSCITYNYNIPA